MARINIEECWWSDPRRTKLLLKIGFAADAAAVNMWRSAQEFWGKGRGLIPKHVYDKIEYAQELIECGLADVRDTFVYVRGCSEYLEWHAEKREQAVAAGKKSAEVRKKKNGSAQPRGGKGSKKSEREPNENRTEANVTEPSLSDSDSDSPSGTVIPVSSKQTKAGAFIAGYKARFFARWNTKIAVEGKDAGIAKRVAEGLSYEDAQLYLDAYFQMPDAEVVKKKHPLYLLEAKMTEVVVHAQTGQFTTQTQARQADNMASNHLLMEKLKREGK